MPSNILRINDLIREKAANFIQQEIPLEDGLITMSRVECAPDLNSAAIYITVLPTEAEKRAIRKIQSKIHLIAARLSKETVLRRVPKLNFLIDQGEKNAQEIDEILRTLGM